MTCCGSCSRLEIFNSIQTLLTFESGLAFLLTEAKDRQNPIAQKVFESLLGVAFDKRIKTILAEKQITTVVVAPLRWGRIIAGGWHPAVFFKQRLKELCKQKNVELHMPSPIFRSRQAKRPAQKREREAEALAQNLDMLKIPSENDPACIQEVNFSRKQYLIIDDVLTTGKSAMNIIHKKRFILDDQNASYHLFTLFRTPRAT